MGANREGVGAKSSVKHVKGAIWGLLERKFSGLNWAESRGLKASRQGIQG